MGVTECHCLLLHLGHGSVHKGKGQSIESRGLCSLQGDWKHHERSRLNHGTCSLLERSKEKTNKCLPELKMHLKYWPQKLSQKGCPKPVTKREPWKQQEKQLITNEESPRRISSFFTRNHRCQKAVGGIFKVLKEKQKHNNLSSQESYILQNCPSKMRS